MFSFKAFYGVIFTDEEKEAGFSNYRLWYHRHFAFRIRIFQNCKKCSKIIFCCLQPKGIAGFRTRLRLFGLLVHQRQVVHHVWLAKLGNGRILSRRVTRPYSQKQQS